MSSSMVHANAKVLLVGTAPAGVRERLVADGYSVTACADEDAAWRHLRVGTFDLLVTDVSDGVDGIALCRRATATWPDLPVIFVTDERDFAVAVEAFRAGAADFETSDEGYEHFAHAARRALRMRALERDVLRLTNELREAQPDPDIVGRSSEIRRVLETVRRVAESDVTAVVEGETGTGKELVARAIHRRSGRTGRFVALNCAALPSELVASELFGHVAGAFSGATRDKEGLFVAAHGGTLFLDEVSELSLDVQPTLLRALQEGVVRPVGSERTVSFDARLVCATNRDLEALVADGAFREDLFYRLNVVRITMPPLRERGDDVLLLAQLFIEREAKKAGKAVRGLSPDAAARVSRYPWPGNVRELENAIERAVVFARYDQIVPADLPAAVALSRAREGGDDSSLTRDLPTLAELERRYVRAVLEHTEGNKAEAARVLGIDRRTLYRKLDRYEER